MTTTERCRALADEAADPATTPERLVAIWHLVETAPEGDPLAGDDEPTHCGVEECCGPDLDNYVWGTRPSEALVAVLANPRVPAPLVAQVAGDLTDDRGRRPGDGGLRRVVAAHPLCPAAALRAWADHPDPYVVRAVAANATTPPDVLERLADHDDADVRAGVAANPCAPDHARALAALL